MYGLDDHAPLERSTRDILVHNQHTIPCPVYTIPTNKNCFTKSMSLACCRGALAAGEAAEVGCSMVNSEICYNIQAMRLPEESDCMNRMVGKGSGIPTGAESVYRLLCVVVSRGFECVFFSFFFR